MIGSGEQLFHLLMPPEFEYLGGIFMPDLDRARLAARLALMTERLRKRGHGVVLDMGNQGLDADETAYHYKKKGVKNATLVGTKHDRTGVEVLTHALNASGIECGRPFMSGRAGEEMILTLTNRIESQAPMDLKFPEQRAAEASAASALLVLESGEPRPMQGVPFLEKTDRLVRLGGGRAGSIPAEIAQIRFISLESGTVEPIEDARDDHLFVFTFPQAAPMNPAWFAQCRNLMNGLDPRNCRLWIENTRPASSPTCGGASWAMRLGLDQPLFRSFLHELVSEAFPADLARFNWVCGLYEIGADPMEEMYAGNSLLDRNAELIENIVP